MPYIGFMTFEWDEIKNLENQEKHGISFEQASVLFFFPGYEIEFDADHSTLDEDRYIATGKTVHGDLVVVFVEVIEDVIRIISARRR